ncbi:MAG: undecaprenyldiphospho-muramoylpentapeptide beta-N-acetylglucosaminyltransferase [Rhodospirillales bacterium]|nr:undecaprenyldiphospho-muramoylpentapeptide beta-N-acetylglucosaminyltransferase [Rhodospirillales bacterium]
MTRGIRVALAAGGTGGHVFPAEALAAELLARGYEPVLITDRRGKAFGGALETMPVHRIRSGGIAGVGFARRIGNVVALALGALDARAALRRIAPQAVIGFGGYAALPTVAAACWLGLPAAIHDQNAVLGRANRLLASRVRRICTAFDHTARVPAAAAAKVVKVGMPVRPAFLPYREKPYLAPVAEGDAPIRLLILGGSQGAKVFSDVIPAAIARLPLALRRRLRITQQCRPEMMAATRDAYAPLQLDIELSPFFADVPARLASAHLVIARAGSSTIGELTAVGRPAILVPYPFAIDDHQTANARALADVGAAWLMPQTELTGDALAALLAGRLAAPEQLTAAARAAAAAGVPDAAGRLADAVSALIPEPHSGVGVGASARRAA